MRRTEPRDDRHMTDRATVAYVDHVGVLGGAEVALCSLISSLDRGQWRPLAVLGAEGPLADRLRGQGLHVNILALPSSLKGIRQDGITRARMLDPGRAAGTARYVLRVAHFLRANRVSLVHANSLRACVLAGLAGRLARIPVVWQIHSIVASPMVSPAGVRLMRTLARRLPHHIICNSVASAACFDVQPSHISVVPCGVDAAHFHPNGRPTNGKRQVGVIARFSPLKGQHVFVEAAIRLANRYPEVRFVVAGSALFEEEGYEREVRERALRSPRSDLIQFLGFQEDVATLLSDVEVVVQPSTRPEGLGQVVIEAMMSGKPVVASGEGGAVDLVEDGVTGLLVPPNDVAALANAIDDLLRDRDRASAMGARGRERALTRYELSQTSRAIESVYETVLTETRGAGWLRNYSP